MNDDKDRLSHANIRSILEAWFDQHDFDSFPWIINKKRVEIPVVMPVKALKDRCLCRHRLRDHNDKTSGCDLCHCNQYRDKIIHVGKLDLLPNLKRDPSVFCPVDNKTTGQLNGTFVAQFSIDSQITGYMADAGYHCDTPAHHLVAYVNALELSLLPTSDRKCATHKIPYVECSQLHAKFQIIGPIERSAQQIEEWRDNTVKLARQYHMLLSYTEKTARDLHTEGTFNGSCRYCEFREWCLMDRSPRQVSGSFTKTRWTPWDHHQVKPPAENELYVDNSILKATASCSTQAMMRYGRHWSNQGQSGPLFAGTAVHLALETWFSGGTVNEALAAFDDLYV